jgi:Icc-related predicted phosphoesterase
MSEVSCCVATVRGVNTGDAVYKWNLLMQDHSGEFDHLRDKIHDLEEENEALAKQDQKLADLKSEISSIVWNLENGGSVDEAVSDLNEAYKDAE